MKNAYWSFLYCSITGVMNLVNIFFAILLYITVFFIVFPFALTILIYVVNKLFGVHPLKAFHRSMAWSTVFYIFVVIQMTLMFYNKVFIGIIALVFLIALSVIIILQRKKETDVQIKKASRLLWRICFLLFILLYIALIIYGIIIRL